MKKGFFILPREQSTKTKGKVLSCSSCGLYQSVLSPKMEAFGNFKKGILNIGEAPGATEDKRGKQWQGPVGALLQKTYKSLGIDLFEDCLNINAINCRPVDTKGNNRPPTTHEVACCRRRVLRVISQHKPKVIVVLGNHALASVLGHRWNKDLGGITMWRGWRIPDREYNAWICPTFHPSYVERSKSQEVRTIWERDLLCALRWCDKVTYPPMPEYEDETKQVHIIDDLSLFDNIDSGYVAIDYETTGLKPHAKGHKIICASVAINSKECYAFMMPEDRKERHPFIRLLRNESVGKIAHNMKFEQAWGQVYLKTSVHNWAHDTMLGAHVIDNRAYITGLKFQTYINFGVMGYDAHIAPYLKGSNKKDGNTHNRILKLLDKRGGKRELLTYCGLDSLFTYRLAEKQGGIT